MIIYSYSLVKTAFVSLLMISSVTIEATCSNSVSDLFNSIVGIPSANEGKHSAASNSNQRPLELKLADAQMLQQWIGQIARKIVVEDGIFAGIYSCGPKSNINAVILTDGLPEERIKKIDKNLLKKVQNSEEKSQFLKLLFSFGAMLSAEIGEQSQQTGTLRAFLKAYECVGGQIAKENDGISDIVIGAVIKSPIEQLKIEKIILEKKPINNLNPSYIQEFELLNDLNIEMTPNDVINFAFFIKIKFLSYPPVNPFNKYILELRELSLSKLDKDPLKYRRIAHQLLLHLKNWGLKKLEEFSLEDPDEDVIKLTQREKCFIGIFARNLMLKIAKFELLDDYFGELNIPGQVENNKFYLRFYEKFSADNCKKVKENEGIENSKIYPFIDEAIRIDWNVWKEIIQQIDELTKTVVKSKDNKQNLVEYLKSDKFEDALKIIRAKFDETKFGQKLKADVKKMLKLNDEKMPEDEIVNQFCSNLAKIRQNCVGNIEQYEREIPLKKNVIIKQKEKYNKLAENHNKFYDFMANFLEHFGGKSFKNDNEESIEFDLKGAKSFLEKVYISANELLQNKNLKFEMAIRAILDKNLNEKTKNLLNEFYLPKEFVKIPPKRAEFQKEDELINTEAQLFNLFFSFAARLEAIVHGKNIDETIEKSRENSKDKIRAFLAVPNCFNVPEWADEFSIFDYWMEIKEIKSKKSQKMPVIGVAIYKEIFKKARSLLQKNYKTLKSLNEYKFSIYESTKLLREIYDKIEKNHSTSGGFIIREMVEKLTYQISSDFNLWHRTHYNYINYEYNDYISSCEYAKLFLNISANFMKMEGAILHMVERDLEIQAEVEKNFGKYCEKKERNGRKIEETKIALLNNVRYDLVINFKLNAWKDVHDRTKDLLENLSTMEPAKEDTCIIDKEINMPYYFTSKETNRILISKIEALKVNENDQFDLLGLFDKARNLTRKIIKKEMPNLKKAKEELKPLEKSESDANDKKKMLYKEMKNIASQIQDKEEKQINLQNEINLLQEKVNKIPEKQRKNAATFSEWLKSNERTYNFARNIMEEEMSNLEKTKEELELLEWYNEQIENILRHIQAQGKEAKNLEKELKLFQKKLREMPGKLRQSAHTFLEKLKSNWIKGMTEETKQILQKICTLSELNLKVKRLKAKMRKSQQTFMIELGDKLSMGDASTSQKITGKFKKLKNDDKITEAADKVKIAELEGLKKLQEKMDLVEEKLKVHLEKAKEFKNYGGIDVLELSQLIGDNLNKTQMTEKMDESEYDKMGKELAQQTDILLTNEFEQKLDGILTVCKFESDKNELNNIKAKLKFLTKTLGEMKKNFEEIDKKLSEILKKKVEVNTLVKELEENKESAREMGKSLRQMLEEMKKHYGQKMDE